MTRLSTFGERILLSLRDLRPPRNQQWLVQQTGFARSTIAAWLTGKFPPTYHSASILAAALKVDVNWLIRDVPLATTGGGKALQRSVNRPTESFEPKEKNGTGPFLSVNSRGKDPTPSSPSSRSDEPIKERSDMPHADKYVRLLNVELDYLSGPEAEDLWNHLQQIRHRGRPPAKETVHRPKKRA